MAQIDDTGALGMRPVYLAGENRFRIIERLNGIIREMVN
jgi:hypothetical protein